MHVSNFGPAGLNLAERIEAFNILALYWCPSIAFLPNTRIEVSAGVQEQL
jgi:hypothetical protein